MVANTDVVGKFIMGMMITYFDSASFLAIPFVDVRDPLAINELGTLSINSSTSIKRFGTFLFWFLHQIRLHSGRND